MACGVARCWVVGLQVGFRQCANGGVSARPTPCNLTISSLYAEGTKAERANLLMRRDMDVRQKGGYFGARHERVFANMSEQPHKP